MLCHPRNALFCLVALASISLAACDSVPSQDQLPSIPAADFDRFALAIQQQLTSAYERLTDKPGKADANGRMAMLLHAYEMYGAAAVLYERAALLDDDEFRWVYLLGHVQSEQGLNDQALMTLEGARRIDPAYPGARIKMAQLYLSSGRLDECRAMVGELLSDDPDRPEANFLQAQLAAREGRATDAVAAFERVRVLSGDFAALHYGLAQAHRQLGNTDAAAKHTMLFEQYRGTAGAIDDPVLAEVYALDISDTQLINRARLLSSRGNQDAALTLLEEAVRNNPDSLAVHMTIVGLYATRGQFDKADEHLARARQIDPNHPQLHYNTGIARLAEDRSLEAARAFRRAIETDPENADAHTQLAFVLEARGNSDEAIAGYRQALTIEPFHRQANWLLGRVLLNTGDIAAAIEHLGKVRYVKDPSAPAILGDLGRAYERADQPDEATEAWQQALDLADRFGNDAVLVSARTALARLERRSPDSAAGNDKP